MAPAIRGRVVSAEDRQGVDHADMHRHLAAIGDRNCATVVQRCPPAVDDDHALRVTVLGEPLLVVPYSGD